MNADKPPSLRQDLLLSSELASEDDLPCHVPCEDVRQSCTIMSLDPNYFEPAVKPFDAFHRRGTTRGGSWGNTRCKRRCGQGLARVEHEFDDHRTFCQWRSREAKPREHMQRTVKMISLVLNGEEMCRKESNATSPPPENLCKPIHVICDC